MGWRDRAEPVSAQSGGWRSRAEPVPVRQLKTDGTHQEDNDVVDNREQFPVADKLEAAMAGAAQGSTFGFADELGGAGQTLIDKLGGDDRSWGDAYRQNRDALRTYDKGQAAAEPLAHFGGEMGGALLVPMGETGKLKGAAKIGAHALQGAGIGGAYAAGDSDADLTRGQLAQFANDTGKGALAGGTVGAGTGALGVLMDRLGMRATGKLAAAQERAKAMGAEKAAQESAEARSAAGRASSEVMNVAKTATALKDLPAVRDPASYAKFLEAAAADAERQGQASENALGAVGHDAAHAVETEAQSETSALVKARKAAAKAPNYRKAAEQLRAEAERVRATGEVPASALERQRDILEQAGMTEAVGNALDHMSEDASSKASKAMAERAMYKQALASESERAAQHADDIISGKAAKQQLMDRVKRYGAPVAGTLAGMLAPTGHGMLGHAVAGGIGMMAGAGAGHALESLAGAGLRPTLRSFMRMGEGPATQSAIYGTISKMLSDDPSLAAKVGGKGNDAVVRVLQMLAGPKAITSGASGPGDDVWYELLKKVAAEDGKSKPEMQAQAGHTPVIHVSGARWVP